MTESEKDLITKKLEEIGEIAGLKCADFKVKTVDNKDGTTSNVTCTISFTKNGRNGDNINQFASLLDSVRGTSYGSIFNELFGDTFNAISKKDKGNKKNEHSNITSIEELRKNKKPRKK